MYGENTDIAKRRLNEYKTILFQGNADQIVDHIRQAVQDHPIQAEGLNEQATYFENHKRRMKYLELRSDGWLIGSGVVESGGKQYKDRFAGPGMHWSRSGAENLLPIRTAVMSNRFDRRWAAIYNSPPN